MKPVMALVGRPNVGKSSLLNALAGRDRALVTPIAGTTRDVVEATIAIRNVAVVLMDTAGIRDADDIVEAMGVARSRAAIADAACVIAVFDRASQLGAEDAMVVEDQRAPVELDEGQRGFGHERQRTDHCASAPVELRATTPSSSSLSRCASSDDFASGCSRGSTSS